MTLYVSMFLCLLRVLAVYPMVYYYEYPFTRV
jgi:hypothetical protein